MRHDWSKLNNLQKAAYGEYYAKMEFTMQGFEVFTSEVDDRGVDFVAKRGNSSFYQVQVKTLTKFNTTFVYEKQFQRSSYFLIAFVHLEQSHFPKMYVFQGTDWHAGSKLLVFNSYQGKKSKPSYEIHFSGRNLDELAKYAFDSIADKLNN